jgi:hypothetical protein
MLAKKLRMFPSNTSTDGSMICVHTFRLGDTEDPLLWAAMPINKWEATDAGAWVMENALEQPHFSIGVDPIGYGGHLGKIFARLSEEDLTYFLLKYGKDD